MQAASAYVVIGQVGRPHGLGGSFFVSGREGPIESSYSELLIGPTLSNAKPTRIEGSTMQGGRPLLKCSLASDRDAASALTGSLIFAARSDIEATRGDGLLWSELEGAQVFDSQNTLMGRVHQVYNAGASDVVEVVQAGRSVDIPLISDYLRPNQPLVRGEDGSTRLYLVVSADFFAHVWNDQTGQRDGREPSDA